MAAGSLRPPALVTLTLTLTLAAAPASGLANRAADANLSLEVVAQPVAYAGYPIVVGVSSDGLPNQTVVTVELDGKNVATAKVFRGQGEATVAVPLGRHRLVARAVLGDEQVASRPRAIGVVPARTWQTAGDNGRYAGTAGGGPVSFEVTGGGREIHAFSARVSMFCVGATIAQNHVLIGFALVSRVRIAPDGRFVILTHPRPKTTVHLTGRLRHGRVTEGEVELTVGTCAGTARYSAHRAGSR
jgi:hypothetical protein